MKSTAVRRSVCITKFASAISGTRFGITEGGDYSFTIDPVAAVAIRMVRHGAVRRAE